jgi:hypothetical protein
MAIWKATNERPRLNALCVYLGEGVYYRAPGESSRPDARRSGTVSGARREYDASSGFTPIPPENYSEWFRIVGENIAAIPAPEGLSSLDIKEHSEDGELLGRLYGLSDASGSSALSFATWRRNRICFAILHQNRQGTVFRPGTFLPAPAKFSRGITLVL